MDINKISFLSLNDIRYICEKTFGMLKIPVFFLNSINNEIIFEYSYEYSQNPLYENKKQIHSELFNANNKKSLLNFISTKYYENYLSLKITTNDNFKGTILIGPSIASEIDGKSINSLIRDLNISLKCKESLAKYYKYMVIMDFNALIDTGFLLYHSVYGEKLNVDDYIKINQVSFDVALENDKNFNITQSYKRRDSIFHHSPAYENELLDCIREGNIEKLKEFFEFRTTDGELGIHSRNPLRNKKNIFISFISLVSHAAFEGGLDWELALSLSDFYIQSVEECNTFEEINNLHAKILFDYTERVHQIKLGNYSSSIIKCQNYIFEHLYEKISLSKIAEYSSLNPSYLSHLFKKEVSLSISNYIQKQRINEAKKLIRAGEVLLADIYVPLGFIDQSHFTKSFKKVVGITPKEYRALYSSNIKH